MPKVCRNSLEGTLSHIVEESESNYTNEELDKYFKDIKILHETFDDGKEVWAMHGTSIGNGSPYGIAILRRNDQIITKVIRSLIWSFVQTGKQIEEDE